MRGLHENAHYYPFQHYFMVSIMEILMILLIDSAKNPLSIFWGYAD